MDSREHRKAPPPARAPDERVLAGVCGGLAHRTGVDPIVFRVAFGVLGCVGVGILLYGAAWLLFPSAGAGRSPVERRLGRRVDGPAVLAVLVAVLVASGLATPQGSGSPTIALVVVLGVAALAAHRSGVDLAGFVRAVPGRLRFPRLPADPDAGAQPPPPETPPYGRTGDGSWAEDPPTRYGQPSPPYGGPPPHGKPPGEQGGATPASPPDDTPTATYPSPAAYAYEPPTLEYRPLGYGEAPRPPPSWPAGQAPPYYGQGDDSTLHDPYALPDRPPKRHRPSRTLPRLTLSVALIVTGILAGVAATGLAPFGAPVVLAAAVTTIGVGLLVGARYGNGRPLVGVGLLASLLLICTAVVVGPADGTVERGGFGTAVWQPSGTATRPYHLTAGEGTLDLTELPPGRSYRFDAGVDFGELRVRVPAGADVTVRARVTLGEVSVDGESVASGPGVAITRTLPAGPVSGLNGRREGGPQAGREGGREGGERPRGTAIELRLNVNLGEVAIRRVSA